MLSLKTLLSTGALFAIILGGELAGTNKPGEVFAADTTPTHAPVVILAPNIERPSRKTFPQIDFSFFKSVEGGGLFTFMKQVAQFESSGKISATNKYGMLGKYQFSPTTLRQIGFRVTRREFLRNESLQDSAMVVYLQQNKKELESYIRRYDGKTYRGVKITESGILAGAHFAGSTGVIRFFTRGTNRRDANGTTLARYMSKFGGYELGI